jgi:5-methylcytosine-specific restriction endonuclease McrA
VSTVRYFNPRMRRKILAGAIPWWVEQHPHKAYIVAANLATPDWVDRKQLTRLHQWARFKTLVTGVYHVVDHIVPLTHPDVCGLTVPWNLRVITYAQNAAKSNKWNPNQLELFA